MSSVVEKSAVNASKPAKKNFFLRSGSIQKIKCSATYPFRIAGSKLSKEALKQLLEPLIIKARSFSQKALIIMYFTSLKILGAISTASSTAPQTLDDICDKSKEAEKRWTFVERLLARLIKIYVHKSTHQAKKEATIEKREQVATDKDQSVESRLTTNLAAAKFLGVKKAEPRKPHPLFIAFVYASAIFIYVQLVVLTFALNSVPTPPGLVFLLISLSAIAYLAFRVFCIQHTSKKTSRRSARQRNSVTDAKSNSTETFGNSISVELTNRQSRSGARRTIDFGTKTLSKIKLL